VDRTNKTLISGDIASAVADAFEIAGGEIVEDIKQRISTAYPPASKAGEAPHRRSGNLLNRTSEFVTTDIGGLEVVLTLSNDAFYAAFLRDGTSKMAKRDFFQETDLDRYLPKVIDSALNSISERLNR
jgi:hypothetical protein